MREEVARIIRHFKLSAILKVLKVSIIVNIAFVIVIGAFSQYPQDNFFFNFFIRLTLGFAVVGFIYSCKRLFLENSCVQLYNTKMLEKLTVDELFELILSDRRIHEEVKRFIPDGESSDIEDSRYSSVRFNHFLTWFQKNISNVEEVCASPDFFKGAVRESFCKQQKRYFAGLIELCSDDEKMLENVRKAEEYVNAHLYKDNVI